MDTDSTHTPSLSDTFNELQNSFLAQSYLPIDKRIVLLKTLHKRIVSNEQALIDAASKDFGYRTAFDTLLGDILPTVQGLAHIIKKLPKWAKPSKRSTSLSLWPSKVSVTYQPLGVVGVIAPWNYPIQLALVPVITAIAAGNRVMLKLSEFTPHTNAVIEKIFADELQAHCKVVLGASDVASEFSALPFAHLLFTGSTSVGKLVMKAASENLTPVTLELGGKSPVIVSDSYPIDEAADSIISGKAMNGGQLCISPDYAFVPATRLEAFVMKCKQVMEEQHPCMVSCHDFVSIINERHYDRIKSYIDDAKKKGARILEINPSKEDWSDRSKHRIPLHLIINPTEDMLCMQDEIFGPILNVMAYRDIQECLDYINDRPHPLALYYYGKDKAEKNRVIAETTAGGMTVNDVTMHFACDDMPFGGVGASGMGHYHGFEGFKTFSHAKSVFTQGKVNLPKLAGTLPPYGEKVEKMLLGQIKK